jgi:hypothetical protein
MEALQTTQRYGPHYQDRLAGHIAETLYNGYAIINGEKYKDYIKEIIVNSIGNLGKLKLKGELQPRRAGGNPKRID